MRGRPSKKTHHPHTGIRWPFCPERFPYPAGRLLAAANPLVSVSTRDYERQRRRYLAHMAKSGALVRKGLYL